ncbi:MAG: 8-amino-7-oxononanoate synthase [Verrucomicrobiota bacterium]
MSEFDNEMARRLDALEALALRRHLRRVDSPQGPRITIEGSPQLNFSSNDYLGLAAHPALREAAEKAVTDFGAGAGASRLLCGSLAPFHELEETLAQFKGTEAALSFSTGYATALGTIPAIVGKGDVVVIDKLVHASIVDAARLSGARLRVFRHNDPGDLERILKSTQLTQSSAQHSGDGSRRAQVLIVTESVFSMDGDLASLREIVELKDRHGAWLMLDEAHATGLFGEQRRGVVEAQELEGRVEIQMGTLGKALGAAGGYIAGSRPLIDMLVNRARSFIFSTAPVPAAAAAATAAIRLVQSFEGETRRAMLWQRVDQVKNSIIRAGWTLPAVQSAIVPVLFGAETRALEAAAALREQGIFVPAIRYPTVARGAARLRVTVTADHSREDIAALEDALRRLKCKT